MLYFANKDPKTNFDDWMIPKKHVLSFKCNDLFKMANLKAISSSATLNATARKNAVDPSKMTKESFQWEIHNKQLEQTLQCY